MGNMTHHYSSVPNESSYNGLALDLPDHNALVLRGLQEKGGGAVSIKVSIATYMDTTYSYYSTEQAHLQCLQYNELFCQRVNEV